MKLPFTLIATAALALARPMQTAVERSSEYQHFVQTMWNICRFAIWMLFGVLLPPHP